MEQRTSWLSYVDAENITDTSIELDGMKVRNDAGDKLGEVDGLLVDTNSGRAYYVVVDAGGWFKSKHLLMPIGQLTLDADQDALVVNLTKDQVERFPGFDLDRFNTLSDSDLARINRDTLGVLEPDVPYSDLDARDAVWNRRSYAQPTWWVGNAAIGRAMGNLDYSSQQHQAAAHDVSPHQGGRAQPGDVLGIETGGEETHVGDTAEDEDKRRESADKSARKK
jgi:hypothetical protein